MSPLNGDETGRSAFQGATARTQITFSSARLLRVVQCQTQNQFLKPKRMQFRDVRVAENENLHQVPGSQERNLKLTPLTYLCCYLQSSHHFFSDICLSVIMARHYPIGLLGPYNAIHTTEQNENIWPVIQQLRYTVVLDTFHYSCAVLQFCEHIFFSRELQNETSCSIW